MKSPSDERQESLDIIENYRLKAEQVSLKNDGAINVRSYVPCS